VCQIQNTQAKGWAQCPKATVGFLRETESLSRKNMSDTASSSSNVDKETSDIERASYRDDNEMFEEDEDKVIKAAKKRRQRFRSSINSKCYGIGSYNIQIGANLAGAIRVAKKAGIAIMAVQEIKGVRKNGLRWGNGEWKLWSSGADSNHGAGVAFLIRDSLIAKGRIRNVSAEFPSPRVGVLKARVDNRNITMVNGYAKFGDKAPEEEEIEDRDEEVRHGEGDGTKEGMQTDDVFELVWSILKDTPHEEIVLLGDFNAHICYDDWTKLGHPTQLMEGERRFMRPKTNRNGTKLLDLCQSLDLKLTSMAAQSKWHQIHSYHGFTKKARTLIDYIAVPSCLKRRSMTCTTVDGWGVGSDHKLIRLSYYVEDRSKSAKMKEAPHEGTLVEPEIDRRLRLLMETAVPRPWYHPEEAAWSSLDTEMAAMRLKALRGMTDKEQLKSLKQEVNRLRRRDIRLQMDRRAENINLNAARRGAAAVMKLVAPMSLKRRKRSTVCLSRKERALVHRFFEDLYTKREVPEFKEWDVPEHIPLPKKSDTGKWAHWHLVTRMDPEMEAAVVVIVRMEENEAAEAHEKLMTARTVAEAEALGILWAIQLSGSDKRVRIYTVDDRATEIFRVLTHHRAQDFVNCETPKIWEHIYCDSLTRSIDIQQAKRAPLLPKGTRIALECLNEPGKYLLFSDQESHGEEEVNRARAEGPVVSKSIRAHYRASDDAPTYEEVEAAVRRLRRRSAPGIDRIKKDDILQVEMAELVDIIQFIWTEKTIPVKWRIGVQIQIPKAGAGGKDITDRLRGITLTSNVSKVLTSIMYYRACAMDLDDALFGFRPGRGTDTPVLIVKKAIRDAVRQKKRRFILFVDYSRMYDTLDRGAVWPLLEKFGFGKTSLELLQKLYDDELLIEVGQGDRRSTKPTRGVRQGCLLSPMIANIAICAAFKVADKETKGVDFDGVTLKFISYADDVVIFADNEEELSRAWAAMEVATRALGLTVNVKKTKLMEVASGHKRVRPSATGFRAAQKQSGHYREEEDDEIETPKLQWDEKHVLTHLCCTTDNIPLRCPECSGDCEGEFYPEQCEGDKRYEYTTAYRLAKHIKEVHFKGLTVRGIDMTHRSCLPRDMSIFDPLREILLRDPRRGGKERTSSVLGEGRQIEVVQDFKYLGVMLSYDGNFDDEVSHRIRESWKAYAALRPLLTNKRLKRHTKVGVWKTYVMSSLLSGAATWAPTEQQVESLEAAMHSQLRSLLRERRYTDNEGMTRTPSRERIRQIAGVAAMTDMLRERRLHVRRSIMAMKNKLAKVVLGETWWSGHADPKIPLIPTGKEEEKEFLIEHFMEQVATLGGRMAMAGPMGQLKAFCTDFKTKAELRDLIPKVVHDIKAFRAEVTKWMRQERDQRITKPDWGKLTDQDMSKCGLVDTDAEVKSKWDSKCEAYKKSSVIPYVDRPSREVINTLMSFKFAWTDGAVGPLTNVAAYAVVEGRWDKRTKKPIACACDYNVVVRPHTNNRGEISGVLKALQRSRKVPLMIVIDSEIAIKSCLGCVVKNNEDLCDIVMAEVRARTKPLALVKVWSHPERKGKPITLLSEGNEMADVLAGYATELPVNERPQKLRELFHRAPQEARSAKRGSVMCYRAEDIVARLKRQRYFANAEEIFGMVGNRGKVKRDREGDGL